MARQKNAGEGASGKTRDAPAVGQPGEPTRAVVIVPVLARAFRNDEGEPQNRPRLARSPEARHEEAVGLARAIDLDLVLRSVRGEPPQPITRRGRRLRAASTATICDAR